MIVVARMQRERNADKKELDILFHHLQKKEKVKKLSLTFGENVFFSNDELKENHEL